MKLLHCFAVIAFLFVTTAVVAQLAIQAPGFGSPISQPMGNGLDNCGLITGQVLSSSGQPVSNASVELRSMETGTLRAAEPSVRGGFDVSCAPPGMYRVTARDGRNVVSEDVQIEPGMQTITLHMAPSPDRADGATVSAAALLVPRKARNALENARKRLRKLDYKGALRLIARALRIDPDSSEAYELRGLIRLSHNQTTPAVQDLDHAVKLDSGNAAAHIMLGAALNDSGQYRQALVPLQAALPLTPDSWQDYFEMARSNAGLGNLREALRELDHALQLNPQFAPIHLLRGEILSHAGQWTDAAGDFRQFLKAMPKSPDAPRAQKLLAAATSHLPAGK